MRAAILRELNTPVEVTDISVDAPQSGEVLVRMQATGVCHSDLSVIEGKIPFLTPMVMGHEGAGIVEAVGPGVSRVKPGDHVIVSWVAMDGTCFYCLHGQPQLCQSGLMSFGTMDDGTSRLHRNGETLYHGLNAATFAERTVLRETAVVPIPDDIPFSVAAIVGCAVTTGVGAAIRTAQVQPGEITAVIGCGGVGLSVIQGCRLAGAEAIVAIDNVPERLEAARRLGATHTLQGGDEVVAGVQAITDGRGADAVFEVVGHPALQRQAVDATRPGGRTILVGVPALDAILELPSLFVVFSEKTVRGCFYGSSNPAREFPWILRLYRAGRLDLDALVTQTLPLERVNDAFDEMRRGAQLRTILTLS